MLNLFHRVVNSVSGAKAVQHSCWKAFHYYTIVAARTPTHFLLRCVNLRSVFQASLQELVSQQFYRGLSPEQAGYIGTLYGHSLKEEQSVTPPFRLNAPRYGRYRVCYLGRRGELCVMDIKTSKERHLWPTEVVASVDLIRHFDAEQSYYIGLLAGLTSDTATVCDLSSPSHIPYLHLV